MGVCNCYLFCCMLLFVRSCIAIILMGKRELVVLLNLSSWCLVMAVQQFLAVLSMVFPESLKIWLSYTGLYAVG